MHNNIILLGYMGSGKSAVGKEIADSKSLEYLDLDDFIEEKEEAKVADIFKTKGEIYFRKAETKYLKELVEIKKNTVISLGGGTPCFGNNIEIVAGAPNAKSIYLQTSIGELSKRLFTERGKRPLIAHTKTTEELSEFIAKHLFERSPYYNQANFVIKTDGKSISNIAEEILNLQ